jgi:membrane fusion protein (multidrug efflux system)
VVVGIALATTACEKKEAPAAAQRPAPPVTVVTVTPRDIPATSSFVATTESSQQVEIVARVSGFLERIAYKEGELVKQGQLLFELDRKPFQAQLEAARGALQAQQARLATAEANLRRVKPLTEQNALSQAELDRAQGEFDSARASVFSAQANVTQAELNLSYTTIRSPVNGLAGRALQRQGAYISATSQSANLTYVAAVDPIWVSFSVSQNQIASRTEDVARGRIVPPKNNDYEVDLVMPDGKPFPERGRINFADPSFSPDTGSFTVRAVLPNPKTTMRPGMFVTAILKGAVRPGAIVVPQLAVQQGSNGHLVYVVNAAGNAEVRPVVVGDYVGDKEIVVVSGLHGGDRVIVGGVLKVVPGQPVQIVDAAAGAAASAPPGGAAARSSAASAASAPRK